MILGVVALASIFAIGGAALGALMGALLEPVTAPSRRMGPDSLHRLP
jgi:hypothetical protein